MKPPINHASLYFNANWDRYQQSIDSNVLYHHEMLAILNQFLLDHFSSHAFTFVDVGCGDSRTVAPVLQGKVIKKYIGIDAAQDVLKTAANTLSALTCEKEFICEDMRLAIQSLPSVDVIYASLSLHHLSRQEKTDFIANCHDKLNQNGFLIIADGVLKENQTREAWLDDLKARFELIQPKLTPEELEFRMQHPRADDFPDAISTFASIAKEQAWRQFEVLFEKDIFAFMVFSK